MPKLVDETKLFFRLVNITTKQKALHKQCCILICCVIKWFPFPLPHLPPLILLTIPLDILFICFSHQANEYACGSYQNSMSRRSLFGAYSHQPNMSKYSYPSDVSLSSHYGYTSWGLWRDTGHLSPSIYSKKRINIRSFSILIMSAAFIVLLAVLSVAALAFYFSTFKSDSTECKLEQS